MGRDWRIGVEDFAVLFCFSLTGRPSAAGSGARGCHDRGGGGFPCVVHVCGGGQHLSFLNEICSGTSVID